VKVPPSGRNAGAQPGQTHSSTHLRGDARVGDGVRLQPGAQREGPVQRSPDQGELQRGGVRQGAADKPAQQYRPNNQASRRAGGRGRHKEKARRR